MRFSFNPPDSAFLPLARRLAGPILFVVVRVLSLGPLLPTQATAQPVTTAGFLNLPRAEAPGTLLSHPITNGSEPIGRTTTINYLNGWVIVGPEQPGSREESDWQVRVYDISDPANPVRRFPSDFELEYPDNSWIYGNHGWNAHGTAQHGNLLLPDPLRVDGFGGLVERAGTNGVPFITNLPVWYSRSSQAGPWEATLLWYNSGDADIEISRMSLDQNDFVARRVLATFDHVGPYGGGDWHPMFFGDLLIMARSGGAAADGIVVYRLLYDDMGDSDPANDSVTPQLVGTLSGGFQGYWPNLFSDGTGLYVIGSTTNILMGTDITSATLPGANVDIQTVATLTVPNFTNASYPVYQDNFGFMHNRKVDMTRFLAGDANPIELTLDQANPPRPPGAPALPPLALPGVDTSQMSLPLGNLWLTGGYPIPGFNQGMGVWVHQQAPDTTPPRVAYHIPQANRANYPRHAPLSFLVHEHPRNGGPRNGVDFMVRPVGQDDALGAFVAGFLIHDFSGNMTFTPTAPLAADTTYQVDFLSDPAQQVGFRDAAGNYIEPYTYRFSTGGGVNASQPPVITGVTATNHHPAPGEMISVTVAATGASALDYRFNFEGAWSLWGTSASAEHIYTTPGRPRVLVQARDTFGNITVGSLRLLVIDPPPPGPRPTQSATLAVGDEAGFRRVWSVNPDSDTVTVVDANTGAKVAEHAVGVSPRGIARDANGRYWVTCHGSDEIRVLNADGTAHTTIPLAYGSAPFGVAPSPDGALLYVTLYGSGEVQRYSAAAPGAPPLTAGGLDTPRAIAISADGARILVTRFISPELHAEITEFDASLGLMRVLTLNSANSLDGGDRAAGVPNYLAGIAISPDGSRAAVVSKQDNTQRGVFFGVGNLTHETTVRSVISFLDLTTHAEVPHSRRDFDNSDSPSAVIYTPLGDMLLVTLQGNNRVTGIDALNLAPLAVPFTTGSTETSPAIIALQVDTGLAPQGLLLDPVSNRLFTQDFMGRGVTVRDAAPLLDQNQTSLPHVATTPAVGMELLPPDVLQGKRIFYNAADPRMSADSYISCATCHIDGGHDGRVWDFTGRAEGLRRTTDLRGRSGLGHGAVHWSGNFDEIQDFEHDIRGPFGGTGFLSLTSGQFAAQHPSPASGKTGLSADLDALAAYVSSLTPGHTPRSPHRNPDGTVTEAAARGQTVFALQNCAACHTGASLTGPALVNVGTQSAISGSRLGQVLPGIDVPTLHGLHATRLYLHHGQAQTLGDVFDYVGGTFLPGPTGELFGEGTSISNDIATQGGGGEGRGYFGGAAAYLGDTEGVSGVRFTNIDGGPGGPARIAIRYLRQYSGGTAYLRVNGAQQELTVLRQFPDNAWQISGWLWLVVEADLLEGAANTIEVLRGDGNLFVNSILAANSSQIATALPHHLVQDLSSGDRADLLAYIRQSDGRDAAGVPLPAPAAPAPLPPSIVSEPQSVTLAEGNTLHFTVAVGGTGPFTYEWRRGAVIVGANSAELHISPVTLGDAGSYSCTVTNAQGSIASTPALLTVNGPLTISTILLPLATVGVDYAVALTATGGVSARTWSLENGILPPGLSLSAAGVISGIAANPARASITVRVADSSGSDTQVLSLDSAPVGGFETDPDLILHYTFDEGGGTRVWDSSPAGANHATDVPAAHWVADGRFGGAYGPAALDAALNNFTPANQADLDFDPRGDAFTISLWCRTTTAASYTTLISKDGGEPYTIQYRMWAVDPPFTLHAVHGGQYGLGLETAGALTDGQWHLATMVSFSDNGVWTTRLYFDDGSLNTEFPTGAEGTAPAPMRVGGLSEGWNEWFGQIDDLRIYRRALSQSEIAALFAAPEPQTFAGWLSVNLTPSQQADPLLGGPGGDADGNALPNLIEFIAPGGLSVQITGVQGARTATLTLARNSAARGVTLIIEFSTDLVEWTPLATSVNGATPFGPASIIEGTGILRLLTVQTGANNAPVFYRLRAVMQ